MPAIPITVRCECGDTHEAVIGEPVRCSCGRLHSTDAPEGVRAAIFRARRSLTLAQRAGLLVIPAAGLLGFALTNQVWGFLAGPVAAVPWFAFVLPIFKRRYAAALGTLHWTSGTS